MISKTVSSLHWICILASFFAAPAHLAAASFPLAWGWSNPYPHGNNIIDMARANGLAVQVAERGQIYTSPDFQAWTPRDSHTTNALRAVTFFNSRVVITGESGTVLYADSLADFKLLSLGTANWLEGVAASPNLLVAVGDNAAIYTSANGASWQRQTPPFTNWLRSVAFGSLGGVGTFVTVGEAGLIATSPDGSRWQKRAVSASEDFNRVRWSNGQFWVLGDSGKAFFSDLGINWQAVHSGATNTLNDVAATTGSRLLVGDLEARLSESRGPWSNELDPSKLLPAPRWTYLSALWNGTNYLIAGRTGMMVEGLRTNTTTSPTFWLPVADSLRNWLWDIKRLPGLYLAVGDRATIMSSLDGIDWQQELAPDSATNSVFLGIGGTTNLAVAVGSGGTIIISPDDRRAVVNTNSSGVVTTNQVSTLGIIWHGIEPRPTTSDLQGVTAFGNLLVVTGAGGAVLTSPDGRNWTKRPTPTGLFLSSVESFSGGLVAVGDDGLILTSPDGKAWTARTSGTANWIYRVRYLGGRLMAVGQNGTILTSADGATWKSQSSGTTRWLNDVQFIDKTFFIVGTQGTVLASTDAVNWASIGTITSKSLYGAAQNESGQLVTVGIEGIVLRSQITPEKSSIGFVDFPRKPAQHRFVFSGQSGQRFTLDRSTDLRNWSVGPQLEIFDPSGLLIYDDSGVNSPAFQFFRATPK